MEFVKYCDMVRLLRLFLLLWYYLGTELGKIIP